MKNNSKQYDSISSAYVSLADIDPAKKYIQFPEALSLLGNVKGKMVLDIGCGNGIFARILAEHGATVEGYDPSEKQIEEAQKIEQIENLGIRYHVADHPAEGAKEKFDCAVALLVLMYATSKWELEKIFANAYDSLIAGGTFVALTFNPNFKRLGQIAHNRRWSKTENGMRVEFFSEGKLKLTADFSDFSAADYEDAAKKAGFDNFSWEKLSISPEGIKVTGEKFWDGFSEDPSYIGIKLRK